jgi:hypothetical protein
MAEMALSLSMNSFILPLSIVSFFGSYLFDLVVTHNLILSNNPERHDYSDIIKFAPNFVFISVGFLLVKSMYGSTIGWIFGVPIGILLHVLYVSWYYNTHPVPNVTTKPLKVKDSYGAAYAVHVFDFMMPWFLVTLIAFLNQQNGWVENQNLLWLAILVVGIVIFIVLYPTTKHRYSELDKLPMKPNCNDLDPRNCRDIDLDAAKKMIGIE